MTLNKIVKAVPYHAKQALRGSGGIALPILNLGATLGGGDGQHHVPTALPSVERHATYFMGDLGGLRATLGGSRKSHHTTPTKIQTPDHPACF
jgi:hypothetical protein